MSKNHYIKPAVSIVAVLYGDYSLMEASGKYNVTVDDKKENTGGGAQEGNPDEIDAKKHYSSWDSWDE